MANFKYLLLCVSTVLISVESQYQNYQVHDYPFVMDRQPYPQILGVYGGPTNSFGVSQPINYVPVNTQGNAYQGGAIFPYPYQYGTQTIPIGTQNEQSIPVGSQSIPIDTQVPSTNQKVPDPFAGVKTEIIDIDPTEFRRLMKDHRSEVQIVSYESRSPSNVRRYAYQPKYIIKTESKQNNKTIAPQSISKHEVQSKSTSFKKTFVIHPNEDGEKVINLNFVNGVQVTEPSKVPEELREPGEADETTTSPTTTLPKKDGRRFIDLPEGCEEGMGFAVTGGCHSLFTLSLNRTNPNITSTTSVIEIIYQLGIEDTTGTLQVNQKKSDKSKSTICVKII